MYRNNDHLHKSGCVLVFSIYDEVRKDERIMMKTKQMIFLITAQISLMGCNNQSREIYFDFHSISLSQNGKEREYRSVLYSDQSGELKFDTSDSFTWTDTNACFTMKLADKTIHTS